jgi:hypothetical protein
MKQEPRKGYYVVCKYKGDRNGDLIVGIIDSVRSNGKVICTNLLTGSPSTKDIKVFMKRNIIVPKRRALSVVELFKSTGDRTQARDMAVALACKQQEAQATPTKEAVITPPPVDLRRVDEALMYYCVLPDLERAEFRRKVALHEDMAKTMAELLACVGGIGAPQVQDQH